MEPAGCEGDALHPLSHGQRALWFLQQLAPESGAYIIARGVRLRAPIDMAAMRRAWQRLTDRHACLRTTFHAPQGEPLQRVHAQMQVDLNHFDASGWSVAELEARLDQEAWRPFDLERGPLLRASFFTRAHDDHILVFAVHHIVSDLWSVAMIIYEMGQLYAAEVAGDSAPALRRLKMEYTGYVRSQAEMLAGARGEELWTYWREQLSGHLAPLELPTDRPRPPLQTFNGSQQWRRLGRDLAQALREISRSHGATLFMTCLAAFQVLLYRYSGQEDFLVGSPAACRSSRTAALIGYFVNPVPLRADLSGNPTFAAYLERTRETVQGAFAHEEFPFPLLVERLQPERDPSRSPLFQVMFTWQKTTHLVDSSNMASFVVGDQGGLLNVGGLPMQSLSIPQHIAQFDMTMMMAEAGEDLAVSLEYNSDLFDAATIRRLLGHYEALLRAIVEDPEQPVDALPLLSQAEQRQLVQIWNDTASGDAQPWSVASLVEAQARRSPEAVAAVCPCVDQTLEASRACRVSSLTYGELNARANRLAHRLAGLGVGPGALVGVCMERSPDALAALLGVLKAGAAYLPLDPAYPPERLAFMLADAQAQLLVTEAELRPALPGGLPLGAGIATLALDSAWSALAAEPATDLPLPAQPDAPAYVIYTSGSTGTPKGVAISYGALARHCVDAGRTYRLTPADRVLQFASLGFDTSLEQILPTWAAGARVVMRGAELWTGQELLERVVSDGITVMNLTPAYWAQVAYEWERNPHALAESDLRLIIIGGDVIPPESLESWRRAVRLAPEGGRVRLLNAYGPTETTVTAAVCEIPLEGALGRLPIGRPLPHRRLYILDRAGNPAPVGVAGELCIGGACVGLGYLNRPELTAEHFVPDPFAGGGTAQAGPEPRMYRTGDLARFRPDGQIEFLGRADGQVKVRGFRVELGEVEAALVRHPAVQDVAVAAREDAHSGRYLAAYIVPRDGALPVAAELRQFLQQQCPEYMIPAAYVFLEALPMTASGKVDRRALPAAGPVEAGAGYVAPRTPVEEMVAGIWAQVLGVEQVGIHTSFFDLGGHSLLATQIISRVREAFQVELPLRSLFETPTVEGMALAIAQAQVGQEEVDEVASLLAELEQLSDDEARDLLAGEL